MHWKCTSGHSWDASVKSRSNGNNCPICSNQKILVGYNDLATTNPELAAQADGWDPTTLTAGSQIQKPWKCVEGHKWTVQVQQRGVRETGCPYCSNRKTLAGYNDLATTNPELAAQADGWDPTTLTAGSQQRRRWKCDLGHTWTAPPNERSDGHGCPSCSISGFDPNKDGWLYFLSNELWGLLQIGITNDLERRLKEHGAQWNVIEVRGPMPGDITHQWEQDVLHSLKMRGVKLAPEHIAGKFSGYTEAWVQEDFPAKSLAELMNLVHTDEEK